MKFLVINKSSGLHPPKKLSSNQGSVRWQHEVNPVAHELSQLRAPIVHIFDVGVDEGDTSVFSERSGRSLSMYDEMDQVRFAHFAQILRDKSNEWVRECKRNEL